MKLEKAMKSFRDYQTEIVYTYLTVDAPNDVLGLVDLLVFMVTEGFTVRVCEISKYEYVRYRKLNFVFVFVFVGNQIYEMKAITYIFFVFVLFFRFHRFCVLVLHFLFFRFLFRVLVFWSF